MADYYLHKTAAHIDELLEKVEGLNNYDDTEVRGLINNKVDKVTGKGLSTNDFTDAYKETLDGLDTALDSKVDKETGKGLSTNDYTTSEKTKLNDIESGANVNVQSDWNQTDTTADDYIKNKPNIPAAQVNADWNAVSGVAQILNKPTVYTKNETDTLLVNKVDKVTGKGLSTNDFTDAYKTAVDDAAPQATTYTKDETDALLGEKAPQSTTYTKTEVDTALAGKQPTLITAQLDAVNSGITASIVNKTSELINGLYMVASVAGGNGNQSLEYTVNRNDFNTMSGSGVDYTGTYLIHCIEWSTEGKPYIGLITFSGGQYSNLTKTDVVNGFTPTITIDGDKFTISRAARISVYALR